MSNAWADWQSLLSLTPRVGEHLYYWSCGAATWFMGTLLLARLNRLSLSRMIVVTAIALLGTGLGARVYALLVETKTGFSELILDPTLLLGPGWRLPGGMLLGGLMGLATARLMRLPLPRTADAAIPFAGLALAVGRLGCLGRGCCHGVVCDLPWAITYGPETGAYTNHLARGLILFGAEHSLTVHPFPFYYVLGGSLITLGLLVYIRRQRFAGEIAWCGIVMIGVLMGGLEIFRENIASAHVPLRQAIPLGCAALAASAWWTLRRAVLR